MRGGTEFVCVWMLGSKSRLCVLAGCRAARATLLGIRTAGVDATRLASTSQNGGSRLGCAQTGSPPMIWQTRPFSAGTESEFTPPPPATIFGVVKVGAQQFKVVPDDLIVVEKLSEAKVNDPVILSDVIMVGTSTKTVIGRPSVPGAQVHAVVEEHFREAKKLAFKKKRRKGYQRLKGHRQVRKTRRCFYSAPKYFYFAELICGRRHTYHPLTTPLSTPSPTPTTGAYVFEDSKGCRDGRRELMGDAMSN